MMKKLIELSDVSICIKKRCILENFSISFSDETDEIAYCPDVPDFPTDMTTLEVLEYSRMLSNKKRKN